MDAIESVLAARSFRDLFGDASAEETRRRYRRFAAAVHPDRNPDARASAAFIRLQRFYSSAEVAAGPRASRTFTTGKHTYERGPQLERGLVANTYSGTYDDGRVRCTLKLARSPRDSDLVQAEADALRRLSHIDERHRAFHPSLLDTFQLHDAATGRRRAGLALERDDQEWFSLRSVLRAYPSGVHGRDVAWMWRRLLVALGTAHDVELVHGSVTLDSVYVQPESHGLVLANWETSVSAGSALRSYAGEFTDLYPAAALAKQPVQPALDLGMGAHALRLVAGSNLPRPLAAFAQGCQVAAPPSAAELLSELDDLLERLYGPRSFHRFEMPNTTSKQGEEHG